MDGKDSPATKLRQIQSHCEQARRSAERRRTAAAYHLARAYEAQIVAAAAHERLLLLRLTAQAVATERRLIQRARVDFPTHV